MFNYFKKMFMLTLRSEFAAGESIQAIDKTKIEDKNTNWTAIDELIQYYNSDREIDNNELTDLHEKIDAIKWNTQTELNNLLKIIIGSNKCPSSLTPEQYLKITASQLDNPMETPPFPAEAKKAPTAAPISPKITPTAAPVETPVFKLKNLAEWDSSLQIEGDKAYFPVKCADWKPHRAYFTIKEWSSITDQASLDAWKKRVTNVLEKKHGKAPEKEIKPQIQPKSQKVESNETATLTSLPLPKTNPDQWIYDTDLLQGEKSNIKIESWVVKVEKWNITWESDKIEDNKFYSIESGDDKITVNWDKLKAILNRQKNYNDRKNWIEPNRKTTLEYKGSPKKTPTTNLDLKEVTADKVKDLEPWKYQIKDGIFDIAGNNLTLEKSWNSLIISDEENKIWNISIKPENIKEALSLLPTILKEIDVAYKESHKPKVNMQRKNTIKEAINSFKYSTSLVSLKEKQKELKSALEK